MTTEDDLRTSPRDVPVREDAEMDENVGALPSFEAEDDWTWSSWTEIFPGGEAYSGTYEAGDLTGRKIEDITPAQIEQVLQVYASSPEGYGSVEYAVVAHLKDGRFASSYGWADMTGWDCRSDALWKVGPTLDAVLAEIEPDMRVRLKPVGGA